MVKVGDKIKIIYMDGKLQCCGNVGTFQCVNGIGQIHGNGGTMCSYSKILR